jgi:hypothetical protein
MDSLSKLKLIFTKNNYFTSYIYIFFLNINLEIAQIIDIAQKDVSTVYLDQFCIAFIIYSSKRSN